MLKNIAQIFLISCIFAITHCILLIFVHSDATPLISLVFVGIFSWIKGTAFGIILTICNYLWVSTTFKLMAPEFTETISAEAIISFSVNIGTSIVLGYLGRLTANLRKEIELRKKAEASFRQLQNELEERVETRTRELENVNDKLRQAEKMETIGLLVGSIAHDFNNFLSIIIGYSALLSKKLDRNSTEYSYALNIEKTTETASELTSLLLKFARKKKYTVQTIDLNNLIREMLPLLSIAVQRGISINHIAQPQLPLIQGGAEQIKSAFLNLSINARDAMKDGGTLTFTTKKVDVTQEYCNNHKITCESGSYAGVSVTDTGSGMEPEVVKHLFEPFFTTKEEGKGTGMGVAAVFSIVKNHKGATFVETELGKGTTFTLLFPEIPTSSPENNVET